MSSMYDRQMKWKRYGEKKLALEARRLDDDRHIACTFTPKTNRDTHKRVQDASKLTHKAEIHAMQTHVARQHKARQAQDDAARRVFFLSTNKNFECTTEVKPFALSVSNRTPRLKSPNTRRTRSHSLSPKKSEGFNILPRKQSAPDSPSRNRMESSSNNDLEKQVQRLLEHSHKPTDDKSWDKERSVLLGIIEAQRNEMKLREKAQHDACKIAEKFATAILAFEERIVAVETRNRSELADMRKAMEHSQSSLQLILQAMGLRDDKLKAQVKQNERPVSS